VIKSEIKIAIKAIKPHAVPEAKRIVKINPAFSCLGIEIANAGNMIDPTTRRNANTSILRESIGM